MNRPSDPAVWERLSAMAEALPDVTSKISHGELTWFVGPGKKPKQFANTWDHHHDDRNSVVMAAPPGAQEQLIAEDPDTFFRPPYVGGRGWIGIHLDTGDVDWDRVELHLRDAHAHVHVVSDTT